MPVSRTSDSFGAKSVLKVDGTAYTIYKLSALAKAGFDVSRLPFSIRVLLESVLRQEDGRLVTAGDVRALAAWAPRNLPEIDFPFIPARVLLQDFTGVPVVVDLAAMRQAAVRLGVDPKRINPLLPVDLVIDHSVQVDFFGGADSFSKNVELEYARNRERYAFLRWGQRAFRNFRVVPPDAGIVHQVNLEYLAPGVVRRKYGDENLLCFDTVIGTDSHTTMINGLGVVGWGVGGIEAEAAMLGQPMTMLVPEVVGFKLTGRLPEGATATDAVLTITQMLRSKGVVGKFVEFYGPGVAMLSLPDRATIANMAPEYGATIGFFPVDQETLNYLRMTGRPEDWVRLTEAYHKEQGLFRDDASPEPEFSDGLTLDLSGVEPSLAGPKRPQDRVGLKDAKASFQKALRAPVKERGFELPADVLDRKVTLKGNGAELGHGSVVLAAITSCTNTSNPSVMLGAGLLAKKAVAKGLKVAPHVKTSLSPGSQVVSDYLEASGLGAYLEKLNFHLTGYGCMTCIGNSGPLPEPVASAIRDGSLVAAAVLSGNRNFEGRINPLVKANYLASPPLVVAYALAGRMDLDLTVEPLGTGKDGKPVYLKDVWPSPAEVQDAMNRSVKAEMFRSRYGKIADGDPRWNGLPVPEGDLYAWEGASTYVKNPPYLEGLTPEPPPARAIRGARVLAVLGDSVTTDHISPAGSIPKDSPAGLYLISQGVQPKDFNSYGARRGNHEVMMRGTFANVQLKNFLLPGTEGGVTVHIPSGQVMSIFDASEKYRREGTPLIVLAGKEYGSGSSRDWAAKGPSLLGVSAVIAESYERIHRSNLVGMGVLPLQFAAGETRDSLGLTGRESFTIEGAGQALAPKKSLTVQALRPDGSVLSFQAVARLDTAVDVDYYRQGGILQTVLRQIVRAQAAAGGVA
ncbi:MAG: aconitate hydratase AcnA [Elusimicrobiota bacterium]